MVVLYSCHKADHSNDFADFTAQHYNVTSCQIWNGPDNTQNPVNEISKQENMVDTWVLNKRRKYGLDVYSIHISGVASYRARVAPGICNVIYLPASHP